MQVATSGGAPIDRASQYLATMDWLSKQPIAPLDDLTARRHRCVTQGQHAGWLQDISDLCHEAVSDSGSISGILGTITRGIPRLPVTVQAPEAISLALTGDDQRAGLLGKMLPRAQQAKALYWGITVGVVPVRIIRDPGSRVSRRIETWESRFLQYEWGTNTWYLVTSLGRLPLEELVYEDGSPEFVLWMPYDSARPWRMAPWRYLSLMAILARDAMYARSRHAQVLSPQRVVEYTEFWTEKQRALMVQILEQMTYNGYLLLPPGAKYSVANVAGTDITQTYAAIINFAREEVEIGLTGQRVTTEGAPGFSSGNVQRDIAAAQLDFYASSWAEFTSTHVVYPCMRDNYGDDIDPVAYSFDTESTDRKVERAEALGKLGDAMGKLADGAAKVGGEVHASDPAIQHLFRQFGLNVRPKSGEAAASNLPINPTGYEAVIKAKYVLESIGLPLFGDQRDDMTVGELRSMSEGDASVPPQDNGGTNV